MVHGCRQGSLNPSIFLYLYSAPIKGWRRPMLSSCRLNCLHLHPLPSARLARTGHTCNTEKSIRECSAAAEGRGGWNQFKMTAEKRLYPHHHPISQLVHVPSFTDDLAVYFSPRQ
jgi:hypothetical protein